MTIRYCFVTALLALSATACAQLPILPTPPAGGTFVEIAPRSSKEVKRVTLPIEANKLLSHDAKLSLLRQKVKYVFVMFQENRSFDFYFGTYPGANGLFSRPPEQTPGFTQPIVEVDGSIGTIHPFRIPATITDTKGKVVPLYPQDTASTNHSHITSVQKLHLDANDIAANDRYAIAEEGIILGKDGKPNHAPRWPASRWANW